MKLDSAISTLEATRTDRLNRVALLVARGVEVRDADSVHIGPDVVVEAGAVLMPFTILEGRTHVAKGARIGPFVRLVDAHIGEDAEILDHCLLRECVVGPSASVGPMAHIRPGSTLGAGSRVGNFVELKKTSLGQGSKASHLSYLGDAEVGPDVNVGAGTITCNYDGVHKHKTRIERGAFIGSDTTLVAPVSVGDGAFVAAGSTVTQDVPAGSLAIGRARQVIKEGWAAKRRALRGDSNR